MIHMTKFMAWRRGREGRRVDLCVLNMQCEFSQTYKRNCRAQGEFGTHGECIWLILIMMTAIFELSST
jgi:hypothetical protein